MWGKTWEEAIGKHCLDLGYESWHAAMHDRERTRAAGFNHHLVKPTPLPELQRLLASLV